MNAWAIVTGLLLAAYLIGSIPFGYLIARSQGIDIRTKGSGNIGATNVWRVMGKTFGLPCFILDVLKGLIPTLAVGLFLLSPTSQSTLWASHLDLDPTQRAILWLGVAIAAVAGHMFPIWLRFKGGKGVATSFGALLGIYPVFTLATLAALLAWLISVKLTRMVGISSCIAATALVAAVALEWFFPFSTPTLTIRAIPAQLIFASVLAAIVIYKHRANLARTFAGTENKLGQKKA